MPTVSGRIVFDRERNANINGNVDGLMNIPVMLQNTVSTEKLLVLTDVTGAYAFLNVPAGTYRIVEVYGATGAVPTPGNFAAAAPGAVLLATMPPITDMPNPPPEANVVDCVTPNTILVVVTAADITGQNIFNGPVLYTPLRLLLDPCAFVFPSNLLTDADFGTFGSFPIGTPANTGPALNPYPALTPDFTYVVPDPSKYTPVDGEFTIQNTMNNAMSNQIGAWWRISDHTTGNESGRMMIVNEDDPGAIIFRTTAAVTPHTTYLFSTWIMNLFRVGGFPAPQFALRILNNLGEVLYSAPLGFEIPANPEQPEWKEIGTVINSQDSTALTMEFFSQGEAAIGNDFAIDDISLRLVRLPQFALVKTESTPVASIGDVVTYTVVMNNACEQPLMNVRFWDYLPPALSFVPESVVINGVPNLNANPIVGFFVPDIYGGEMMRVTFQVRVDAIPTPNPLMNQAMIQYLYTPIPGGFADVYNLYSNELELLVESVEPQADLAVTKAASRAEVCPGDTLAYSILLRNNGPDEAVGIVLHDAIPHTLTQVEYALSGGTWLPWTGSYPVGALGNNQVFAIEIRGVVENHAQGMLCNTARVTAQTPDSDPNNNSASVRVCIRGVRPPCCGANCCANVCGTNCCGVNCCGANACDATFGGCCPCCRRPWGDSCQLPGGCVAKTCNSQWIECGCE